MTPEITVTDIAQDKFSHPYFWAPYVMIGDADRVLNRV